jgi:hypothetical protein
MAPSSRRCWACRPGQVNKSIYESGAQKLVTVEAAHDRIYKHT